MISAILNYTFPKEEGWMSPKDMINIIKYRGNCFAIRPFLCIFAGRNSNFDCKVTTK